jgi:glutamine cyclotransferase
VQFVRLNGQAVRNLNELEYINGEVWANVWMSDQIVTINPESGQVTAVIDFRGLREQAGIRQRDAVLNGIAWDADNRRLFVTGKLWPALFEVQIPGMGDNSQ